MIDKPDSNSPEPSILTVTPPKRSVAMEVVTGVGLGMVGAAAGMAAEAAIFRKSAPSFKERFLNAHMSPSLSGDFALMGIFGGVLGYERARSYNEGIDDSRALHYVKKDGHTNLAEKIIAEQREKLEKSAAEPAAPIRR